MGQYYIPRSKMRYLCNIYVIEYTGQRKYALDLTVECTFVSSAPTPGMKLLFTNKRGKMAKPVLGLYIPRPNSSLKGFPCSMKH